MNKNSILCLVILTILLAGCSSTKQKEESIGSVEMKENGTLVFQLIAEDENRTIRGHGYFEVKKEDEHYQEYLSHVSPIKPGESRLVTPWEN